MRIQVPSDMSIVHGERCTKLLEVKQIGKRRQTLEVDKFLGIKGILNFLKSSQLYIYIYF